MYGYSSSNDISYFSGHLPLPDIRPPSNLGLFSNEFDSLSALILKQEFCYTTGNTSSGCSSYGSPSSLTSNGTTQISSLMQRSVSSHSLQKNVNGFQYHQPTEFLDSDSSPVRKVFSTGDLHRINMVQHNDRSESPLSNESSIIEGVNAKATRYSPEKKKERIERYRSKRNKRDFNKKIKYVCRKTLADSRPRIRGRFARNDEIEKAPQNEWNHLHMAGDYQDLEEYDDNWINFLDANTANLIL